MTRIAHLSTYSPAPRHCRACLLLLLLLLPMLVAAAPIELEGHTYPDTVTIGDQPLQRVGVALFKYKRLFKLNTAGLYLEKAEDRDRVLSGEVPLQLDLTYCRALKREVFIDTAANYMARNVSVQELEAVAEDVKKINSWFKPVVENDCYSLTYFPGTGTRLALNGDILGTIPGPAFVKAYLTIWLGEESIGKGFTNELLGK
ncbi:MAG: hypothetical protein ACI9TH_000297 [Kiritimatiellia bacterium]|jgi:hypothetical protein